MIEIKRAFRPARGFERIDELPGYLFTPEMDAHTFIITKMEKVDGQETAVPFAAGTEISARLIKADGVTELVDGSLADGAAVVTLPAECYQVPGRFTLTVYASLGGTVTCIYAATSTVLAGDTEDLNIAGGTVRNIDAKIGEIRDAISDAQDAVDDIGEAVAGVPDVIASIPQDYTALSNSVGDLKSAIDTVDDFSTLTAGTNIFPGYMEPGSINNTTGEDYASTSNVRSGFIPVDASKETLYVLRQSAQWGMRLFFYDANKDFISPNVRVFTGTDTALSGTCSIPAGAAYIRTYRDSGVTSWVMLSYSVVDSYIEYTAQRVLIDGIVSDNNLDKELTQKIQKIESIESTISDLKNDLTETESINIFDGTFPESGIFDANGVDSREANYKKTNYIPVDASNSTLYVLRTAQPYLLAYCFYDETGTGLGRASLFSASNTTLNTSVSIPSTAKTLRLYTSVSAYSGNLMLSYTEQAEYVPYGTKYVLADGIVSENNLDNALKEKINQALKLTGKTIAFFGDSIIGNFYDSTGVCAKLAELTGATVINCAFGGSRMAYEYSKWGDATPEASGYVDGATDAQKNQVDQYRYWNTLCGARLADAVATGTWTMQENAVANMTGKFSYFADRLNQMKNLDWSTVDFIIWEYGTNDFMTNVALIGNDLFAYDYAYRHAIETILTAYPQIRIITATPMYRWYQADGTFTDDSNTHVVNDYQNVPHKLTDFVETAQDTSKEYQIACIDDYYTLCANRYTRLAFFNPTDGTHPNEQGRSRLAEHIAAQLLSLI